MSLDPGPTQSRLSCGLRLACSDVLSFKVWNVPDYGDSSTTVGSWPPLGCTQRGKGLLSAAWPLNVSACAAASHLPTKQHWSLAAPPPSPPANVQECCWVSLKLCLLPAKPALVLQILLAEQGLQLYHLGGIPSPPISSVYTEIVAWQS